MTPHAWTLIEGDCVEQMAKMDDCSVDAVVCDPPYGLEFMGKEWDRLDTRQPDDLTFHRSGAGPFDRAKVRFASAPSYGGSVGRGMQEWHERWAIEALRVLKPGGHLLAFGGTRTSHRLACAIEDAGFEIRDTIAWMYGSGFPKSLDVSKTIDRARGVERDVTGISSITGARAGSVIDDGNGYTPGRSFQNSEPVINYSTRPATPEAQRWGGWGTALKPAHEPIVVARKPLSGTVSANVLEHGTGAINIDGCRLATGDGLNGGAYTGEQRRRDEYTSTDSAPGAEPLSRLNRRIGEYEQPTGRWPANVALAHTPDCELLGTRPVKGDSRDTGNGQRPGGFFDVGSHRGAGEPNAPVYGDAEVEYWDCAPGCPVRLLDEQSGDSSSTGGRLANISQTSTIYGGGKGLGQSLSPEAVRGDPGFGDSGGASRFFYCAKASRAERNAGLDGFEKKPILWSSGEQNPGSFQAEARNHHPTVKPIDLMRWLVRLVTPPGGLVLDPFAGSGTTGIAARLEGFRFIGIEREPDYIRIAQARIDFWAKHPTHLPVEQALDGERARANRRGAGQLGLFG